MKLCFSRFSFFLKAGSRPIIPNKELTSSWAVVSGKIARFADISYPQHLLDSLRTLCPVDTLFALVARLTVMRTIRS